MLGVSEVTITRRAKALGGKKNGRVWEFDLETLKAAGVGGGTPTRAERASVQDGVRAAAVFEKLDESVPLGRIVTELGEPPEFVKRMRQEWIDCQRLDRADVEFKCTCGAPSNPRTARCDRCHARTQVLTDAQRAELAGNPLPDTESTCTGCGQRHVITDLDRLCRACVAKLVVLVSEGQAKIVLRVGSSATILRALSQEEVRAVAALAGPAPAVTPAGPFVPTVPVAEPTLPRPSVASEIRSMQDQLDATMGALAQAKEDFEKGAT